MTKQALCTSILAKQIKIKKPCCLLPIHLAYDEAGYMLLKVDTTIRKGFHRAVYKDYANV